MADQLFDPVPASPCLEWQGSRVAGYGRLSSRNPRRITRILMEMAGHDIEGKVVMHLCDNPPCCRLDHLRVGTVQENTKMAYDRGQVRPPVVRGERNGRAVLTEDQVAEIRRSTLMIRDLAELYGVSSRAINKIKKRETWRHIP